MKRNHPYKKYEGTAIWKALTKGLKDLHSNGDIRVETAPAYVIGYLSKTVIEELRKSTALTQARPAKTPGASPGVGLAKRSEKTLDPTKSSKPSRKKASGVGP